MRLLTRSRLSRLIGLLIVCRVEPSFGQEAGRKTPVVLAFVDAGEQHSKLKELNRTLAAQGNSGLAVNYASLGFGVLVEFRKFGMLAGVEGVTHRTSMGAGGDVEFRQTTVGMGAHYKLVEFRGLSFGPSLALYAGKYWFDGCSKAFDRCGDSRHALGIDAALRTTIRIGWRAGGSGPFISSLLGYRQQLVEGEWVKENGERTGSNPSTNSSGSFTRLAVGFWF